MRKFKDAAEKPNEWFVSVTKPLIEKIKADTGMDLFDVQKNAEHFHRLAVDTPLLLNVIYLVCEKQVRERSLSVDEFFEGMQGQTFDDFLLVFNEEFIDFFPSARRQVMRAAMEKSTELTETTVRMAVDHLNSKEVATAIQKEVTKAKDQLRQMTSDAISTGSLDSLDLTRIPTRSANSSGRPTSGKRATGSGRQRSSR